MIRPRPARARHRPVAIWALALIVSGCSFRLVRPPPPRDQWPNPVLPSSSQDPCTDTYMPAIADFTFGALFGSLAYVERNSGAPQLALAMGIGSLPLLASGIYGLVKITSCRNYKARFQDAAP